MQHIQGAVIAGAVFEISFGVSGLAGRIVRFMGQATIAPMITLIGLSLLPFGAPPALHHGCIGGLTILLIIVFALFPILIAILLALGRGGRLYRPRHLS